MMREGRWRNDVDPAAAAGRWPGADRRRSEQQPGDLVVGSASVAEQPREVSMASAPAVAYRHGELDDADKARFDSLLRRFELDPEHVHPTFYVGRTRRGHVLVVVEYEHDADGMPVVVLGQPVTRVHVQPVGGDELPVACRKGGDL